MATDACEDGKGCATDEFASWQGFFWGRLSERHRFSFQSAVQGRKHALADLDPLTAIETVEDLSGKCEVRCVADGARATGWLFYPVATHLLEARAQIRCAIRCERWYRKR